MADGGTVLALVGGEVQPGGLGEPVCGAILSGIDAELGGVHPQADDPLRTAAPADLDQAFGELEPGLAAVGPVHVADEHDPAAGLGLTGCETLLEPGEDVLEVLAAARCRVGVKKLSR